MEQKYIYIIVTQTGTILSQILKTITGAKYNHSSISLCRDIEKMYSFGRIDPYNPVWGGFVQESINNGTFKRFKNTQAVIIRAEITNQQYKEVNEYLNKLYNEREKYGYNYLGLILAGVKLKHKCKTRYYCSEFVRDTLVRFKIISSYKFPSVAKPIDFLNLENFETIYKGKLRDYPDTIKETDRFIPYITNINKRIKRVH